ncbi:hypothetical protein THAOC_25962 [Thalassiosira oceanica]|uniref:Uncharacterized protein n=1 Tax=Thalassiosira oceanica TaxID=159749 RepID=K0RPZ9_THAOC|nr:hypothetical protein THAOC_25962 [Thalassiosira oceanica]|eukprot:EJK54414.1 hypothetical protein THAOC_25962 [Thalassiosira oceanica]
MIAHGCKGPRCGLLSRHTSTVQVTRRHNDGRQGASSQLLYGLSFRPDDCACNLLGKSIFGEIQVEMGHRKPNLYVQGV